MAAFPLAPLFALINNAVEIRIDAKKLLLHHRQSQTLPDFSPPKKRFSFFFFCRRPVAQRIRDIGIWMDILENVGRFAVLANVQI